MNVILPMQSPPQKDARTGHRMDRLLTTDNASANVNKSQWTYLYREHGIFRGRIVSIRHIALSNAHNNTFVAIIMQVEHLGRRTSRSRLSHNAQTRCVPDKVLSPRLSAWMKNGDDFPLSGSRPSRRFPRRSLQKKQTDYS